jgi:hypothetical protein
MNDDFDPFSSRRRFRNMLEALPWLIGLGLVIYVAVRMGWIEPPVK